MGDKQSSEFGIYAILRNADSKAVIDGRCHAGVLSVGDEFRNLYGLTIERTATTVQEIGRTHIAEVALKLTMIEAYGRELSRIEAGLTARLHLEGSLPLMKSPHMVLTTD